MVFCGQCGFQLAPGTTRCPRCGAFTDVDTSAATVDALHADDPTSMSMRATQNPSRTTQRMGGSMADQSPLVLRGNTNTPYNPDTQGTYGATARGTSPSYETYAPPQVSSPNQQQGNFAGNAPQTNTGYSPQSASYADFHTPDQMGYPPAVGYQQWQQTSVPARSSKGRVAALLLILFGVLLILGAMVLFALRHQLISSTTGASNGTNSTTITTTTATPAEQAAAVIKQHYTDINNQDYQAAYQLWRHNPASLAAFRQGYAHTRHVALTIDGVSAQSDGTEKVMVTLNATEDNPSGQGVHHSLYRGYYIVGSVNGIWLIFEGQLH